MYNYSKLLYNEDNSLILENKYLDRFYFTNNVAESIHHKLNLCLQKRKTTCLDFIESIRNCLTNDETKIGAIERYDIKSRTLISIIQCENLKKNFKWINMNEYKEYLKVLILKKKGISNEIGADKYICLVEDIDEKEIKSDNNNKNINELTE